VAGAAGDRGALRGAARAALALRRPVRRRRRRHPRALVSAALPRDREPGVSGVVESLLRRGLAPRGRGRDATRPWVTTLHRVVGPAAGPQPARPVGDHRAPVARGMRSRALQLPVAPLSLLPGPDPADRLAG